MVLLEGKVDKERQELGLERRRSQTMEVPKEVGFHSADDGLLLKM